MRVEAGRRSRRLAVVLIVVGIVALAVTVIGAIASDDLPEDRVAIAALGGVACLFGVTGAALAAKRPQNALLWVMAAAGICITVSTASSALEPTAGPLQSSIVYLGNGFFFVGLALFVCFFPLLFPDGGVPSRRWKVVAWIGVAATVNAGVWAIVSFSEDYGAAYWPLGSVAEGSPIGAVLGVGFLLVLVGVIGGFAALVVRYWRGDAELRLRMRVPLVAVLLWLPFFIVISVVLERTWIGETFGAFVNLALPVLLIGSLVVAITRYGLYDIDRIISRTITYAIVVGGLALLFAAGAVWLPTVLPFENNNLAVAASTLAVAALFNPLRRRVQRVVDRRFHRTPYDPELVTGALAAALRDQVDPEQIADEWLAAAATTMEPMLASAWVKEAG